MHRRYHRDSGFSLTELLTVIAVMGLLLGVAITSYWYATSRTYSVVCQSNRRTFESALQSYFSDHNGLPPDNIDDLAPYVHDFDSAVFCPGDPETRLEYDSTAGRILCSFHDN